MVVEGAMLAKVDDKELLKVSTLFGSTQAVILLLGNLLATYLMGLLGRVVQHRTINFLSILSVCIFVSLGIYMLWKGLRDEQYYESRHAHIDMNHMTTLALLTSIDGFLVGAGMSFIQLNVVNLFVPVIFINIFAVVLGIYTGYWYGIEQKSKAQTVGGGVLLVIGFQLLFRNLAVII